MFERTIKKGKSAAIVKCADLFNNSFYLKLVDDTKLKKQLVEKMKYFLKMSKPLIENESVWHDLNSQYSQVVKLTGD